MKSKNIVAVIDFPLFDRKWRAEVRTEESMDLLGRRAFSVTKLYGGTFPKSHLIILRDNMPLMELVDTICHEVFHSAVSYDAPEEFCATEAGTASAYLLREFGLLNDGT